MRALADATAILDWGTLLAIVLAQPDRDTAINQMHRVAWQIIDHARAINIPEEAKGGAEAKAMRLIRMVI
jgi:hypothetical protein